MKTTFDKWSWVLIYGGLGSLGLGLAVQRQDAAIGWPIAVAGAVAVGLGALLIFLRSRMNDSDKKKQP